MLHAPLQQEESKFYALRIEALQLRSKVTKLEKEKVYLEHSKKSELDAMVREYRNCLANSMSFFTALKLRRPGFADCVINAHPGQALRRQSSAIGRPRAGSTDSQRFTPAAATNPKSSHQQPLTQQPPQLTRPDRRN